MRVITGTSRSFFLDLSHWVSGASNAPFTSAYIQGEIKTGFPLYDMQHGETRQLSEFRLFFWSGGIVYRIEFGGNSSHPEHDRVTVTATDSNGSGVVNQWYFSTLGSGRGCLVGSGGVGVFELPFGMTFDTSK